ncbi:MAG TPA: MarR family transcriptional regulator [Chloroflexia bacterium]|nr:MarR family transcriptional regulator [Chloroflexia bacterium]
MEYATDSETSQKLLKALIQFRRADWHHRTVAGCKPSEVRLLMCIKRGVTAESPEIKVSSLSRLLNVTSPTVTQLLNGLEAQGLIERHIDPSDRRAVGISLTEKGEQITQQAMEDFHASLQGLIEYLGEEESDRLAELLFKLSRYYQEKSNNMNQACWDGDKDA